MDRDTSHSKKTPTKVNEDLILKVAALEMDLLKAKHKLSAIEKRSKWQNEFYLIIASPLTWVMQNKLSDPAIRKCALCFPIYAQIFIDSFDMYSEHLKETNDTI